MNKKIYKIIISKIKNKCLDFKSRKIHYYAISLSKFNESAPKFNKSAPIFLPLNLTNLPLKI